jgi:hypothetical protein
MIIHAVEIAAAWIVLCCGCAAGLHIGQRLWVMASVHCDWADAGARIRVKYTKRYPAAHRRQPRPVRVSPGVMVRSDRLLPPRYGPDGTQVITAVPPGVTSARVTIGPPEPETETIERQYP